MSFIQEKVLRYRGAILRCEPVYGWGWSVYRGTEDSYDHFDFGEIEQSGSFDLRIRGFCMSRIGNCAAFVGEVIETKHMFCGHWIVAHIGDGPPEFDLITTTTTSYSVEVFSKKYRIWKKYDWPLFPKCDRIHGSIRGLNLTFEGREFAITQP